MGGRRGDAGGLSAEAARDPALRRALVLHLASLWEYGLVDGETVDLCLRGAAAVDEGGGGEGGGLEEQQPLASTPLVVVVSDDDDDG